MKNTTAMNADKRFIEGKAIENKQKAEKSAASKVQRLRKQKHNLEDLEISLSCEKFTKLHLNGKEVQGVLFGQAILSIQDVSFAYDTSCLHVIKNVSAQIMNGDRILLAGRNGQGKSTLAKLVMGELEPTAGSIAKHVGIHTAYFPQSVLSDTIEAFGSHTGVDFLRKTG